MADRWPIVLIVEDSDEDYEATIRALRRPVVRVSYQRCVHGDDALEYLYHTGKYDTNGSAARPALILLDLNMPGMGGQAVLEQIKQDHALKSIPIIILSTSADPKDIEDCYQHGVNSYLIKPVNYQKFRVSMQSVYEFWLEVVTLPEVSEQL